MNIMNHYSHLLEIDKIDNATVIYNTDSGSKTRVGYCKCNYLVFSFYYLETYFKIDKIKKIII